MGEYPDGGYDGGDIHNALIERLSVNPFSLRQYHLTADDLPAISVRRGGIQYPKRTTMPSLNHQLTALENKQENLAAEIANLKRKIKAQRTAPPAVQHAWTIDVRFERDGKLYNFLILRVNGMFYTTGVQDSYFRTWTGLLEWLDSTAGHSAMIPLRGDYEQAAPLEGRGV